MNDLEKQLEDKIRIALARYPVEPNINDGWNILRWAKQGRLDMTDTDFDSVFIDWYPRNPDFLILRAAKAGQLFLAQPKKAVDITSAAA
jgi:hypothetical protein